MARINIDSIKEINKERNSIHEEVEATYTVFNDNGNKYIQIDTYGKSSREIPGKISQSFQLDCRSAEFLVRLLASEFDLSFKIK